MSKGKGLLDFKKSGQELDFQKNTNKAYWRSSILSLGDFVPKFLFFSDDANIGSGFPTLKLNKLDEDVMGDSRVEVTSFTSLSSGIVQTELQDNGELKIWNESTTAIDTNLVDGVYQLELQINSSVIYVSEPFCKQRVLPVGVYQNIFNSTGYTGTTIEDDSSEGNDGLLWEGWGLFMEVGDEILLPSKIDWSTYTVTNGASNGAATIDLDATDTKLEVTVRGYVFNLDLTDGGTTYLFPCCEGAGQTLHDINYAERALFPCCRWQRQREYFYLDGMSKLTSSKIATDILYIPYNQLGAPIYVTSTRADNYWLPSQAYLKDQIVWNEGTYYKANADFTSAATFTPGSWTTPI
jgi:hypothetical protein